MMKRNQSGFTLIEIAIVLVIIGLLLGGILKGQELINSAKVKNLATDFRNVPVYIYGYQDKFKALPGDDANVDIHLGGQCATTSCKATGPSTCSNGSAGPCTGNGVIDGNWNDAAGSGNETTQFWQHVRLAGLAPGPTLTSDAAYLPTNAAGGQIGVQSGTNNPANTPIKDGSGNPIRGTYIICSAGILGKFVKQLDIQMDDGNPATGSMLAGVATAAGTPMTAVQLTGTGAIDDALTYTVCMGV
jgi:prepilin-type N-terminal cleavage/methylation domain-containing protein